ncbi:MAG: aminotransferase class IV, partial [Deltaproteobacteria bacterium]|nr:aminotransferase class IV [Deltaproteobacteria bacterium]
MKRYAYVNNRLVSEEKATVSVFDRGLNYGHGVFETIKAIDGKAAYLKEHLDRLKNGALAIGIKKGSLRNLFDDIRNNMLQRLLKANGLGTGQSYIRITITSGKDYGTHLLSKNLKPTIIIIAKPIDVKMISSLWRNGVKALTISGIRPALGQIKSLNYLPNVLAKMEAKKKGVYEGIFITPDGSVLDGASTNVFIVVKGVIKTPLTSILSPTGRGRNTGNVLFHNSLSPWGRGKGEGATSPPPLKRGGKGGLYGGILPGIMRQAVVETAKRNGFKAVEGKVTV